MDIFTLLLWVITLIWFVVSMKKDKKRTLNSVKMSTGMMKSMIGHIIGILFLIGLLLTFIPPEMIKEYMGDSSSFLSTVMAALVGSITLIPAFVAFPLVSSLLDAGAGILPVVAFLTTLTMVGVVTFPLEKKEFGVKFALARNIFSFGFAILIAVCMGVII
ncbi:permease [Romboutsia sp.]|uniref:permease n=1 Tax=Romboutsia sp. TaxID=1965302 RepID=UPI003F373340